LVELVATLLKGRHICIASRNPGRYLYRLQTALPGKFGPRPSPLEYPGTTLDRVHQRAGGSSLSRVALGHSPSTGGQEQRRHGRHGIKESRAADRPPAAGAEVPEAPPAWRRGARRRSGVRSRPSRLAQRATRRDASDGRSPAAQCAPRPVRQRVAFPDAGSFQHAAGSRLREARTARGPGGASELLSLVYVTSRD
jgi:hypothetical protein